MEQINYFDNELKYKLYSDITKIIHPTISKKNISSYKIVLNEDIVPVRVFYPHRVSQLDNVIIYIHGISSVSLCNNRYSYICTELAYRTNQLVIAIDYDEEKKYLNCLDDCLKCAIFLKDELDKVNISSSHITLMGDSIGATMVLGISKIMNDVSLKTILVSPVVSDHCFSDLAVDKNDKANRDLINNLQKYYKAKLSFKKNYKDPLVFPYLDKDKICCKALVILGDRDIFREDILDFVKSMDSEILEIEHANHTFLKDMDFVVTNTFYNRISLFLLDIK